MRVICWFPPTQTYLRVSVHLIKAVSFVCLSETFVHDSQYVLAEINKLGNNVLLMLDLRMT